MSRICIDFDGVIFDKGTGMLIEGSRRTIWNYCKAGHEVTIFTNRPDYEYTSVKAILDANSVPYDRIICGKPSYDVFIDDRNQRFTGWNTNYLL